MKKKYRFTASVLVPALLLGASQTALAQPAPRPKIKTASTAKFLSSIEDGWDWVATQCGGVAPASAAGTAVTDQCAADALWMASSQCSASAKFLTKDSKSWRNIGIGLLIASAVFTGVGASPTLANAKIWSTLGGTTALGAVTSAANSNFTTDQAGVAAVNSTLGNLITYVTTGAPNQGVSTAPVITSPASASGTVGTPFSYQIGATNSPTSYSATGLPVYLNVSATGLITGTPDSPGTSTVTLGATNASGTSNAVLTLIIGAAGAAVTSPMVTSPASASGTVGSAFLYQIAATNSPTSYSATGLPAPLTVSATGLISGTPASPGTLTVTLGVTNAAGTNNATLTLIFGAASGGGPAPNALVYKVASLYAAQCTAVALNPSK